MFQFYIQRKTDCTYPPVTRRKKRTSLKQTSQKTYKQYSAQQSRHDCTSKLVTAQCWGGSVWGRAKTFTTESSGTDKGLFFKSIAGKQTKRLSIPSAAEHL